MSTVRTRPSLAAATIGLIGLLVACTPVAPPPPPDPTGARMIVAPEPSGVAPGTVVTVSGAGYDPAGNIGTRPPFFGQPAGVYVVFGRFAGTWRPSQGAPSSARQIIKQVWALPQAQHDVLDPTGANPEIVLMNADGTFTAPVALTEAAGTGAYGIATYAASGAVNAAEERFVPVTFAP